jgi:hypothetical protein
MRCFIAIAFQLCSRYAIRKVHVNQDGLKLNCAHLLMVSADDVNIMGGSIHTIRKNTDALVVASKEMRLEVNTDKTLHMAMSQD